MQRLLSKIFIYLLLMVASVSIATPTEWQSLASGLEYTKMRFFSGFRWGYIHVFRIDPHQYYFGIAFAKDIDQSVASVRDLTAENKALIGINGGFFSSELIPLGLRASERKIKNPVKSISWWKIFFLENEQPHIVSRKSFNFHNNISFAIQSGPQIVINGKIPPLKPGDASRSVIGITKDGKVMLLVTENLSLSTTLLAKIVKRSQEEGGLDCVNALNLDGGSSSQIYAKIKDFKLDIPGFASVTDAIIVKSKE